MILRLAVENFYSIKNRVEVSFATNKKVASPELYYSINEITSVSKVATFQGANASGKSNFLRAVSFLQWLLTQSQSLPDATTNLPLVPFALTKNANTKLELDFSIDSKIYSYAVELNMNEIVSEQLDDITQRNKEGRKKNIFTRITKSFTELSLVKDKGFGTSQDQHHRLKKNASFVAFAAYENSELANSIVSFIKNNINSNLGIFGTNENVNELYDSINYFYNNSDELTFLTQILNRFDFSINHISISEMPAAGVEAWNNFLMAQQLSLPKNYSSNILTAKISHKGKEGREFQLDLSQESTGTISIISKMHLVVNALINGGTVIWDEFESHLHPHLQEEIINMFSSPTLNPKGAQLIMAGHSTVPLNLLDKNLIFLVERDQELSTSIYSLDEVDDVRNDHNFANKYLAGVYGGVPSIR